MHLGRAGVSAQSRTGAMIFSNIPVPTPEPLWGPQLLVPSLRRLGRKALTVAQTGNSLGVGGGQGGGPGSSLTRLGAEAWSKSPDLNVPLKHSLRFPQASSVHVLH